MHVIIFVAMITSATGQIPLSAFYKYGVNAGDNSLPSQDDASTRIPIQFDYPFFGFLYREVHITTNGLLLFGAGSSSYTPDQFPLLDMKCIATYWTDSDPSKGGTVFYRETNDPGLLDGISQEIRTRLIKYSSFTSQWALIVTFDRVSAFGCSPSLDSQDTCRSNCSKVITHQAILTSNGINSFAIFNFNKLDYTVGTAKCNAYAQIGFNAGDGKRFYVVPSSNTPNISSVGLSDSNVGLPGKWIFATDGEDISGGCNTKGLLEIFPRRVLYFGGEQVSILGPCFNNNDSVITVLFELTTSVTCQIENGTRATCRVPLLDKAGRNSISLVHNSIVYESFIMAIDVDDATVTESTFKVESTNDQLSAFTINWSKPSNVSTVKRSVRDVDNSKIVFNGYQRNYYIGESGGVVFQDSVPINYGPYSNTGSITLTPFNSPSPPGLNFKSIFREILVVGAVQLSSGILKIAGRVILLEQIAAYAYCSYWYNTQPSEPAMRDIVNEVSSRSSCPPAVQSNFPQTTGNFVLDESCNPSTRGKVLCGLFHDGAKGCYRSTNNGGGPAAQCCYGDDNSLLLGPPGGGTLDFKDSSVSKPDHFLADVLPYISCCMHIVNQCNKYYEKRPSIDSRNFQPPTTRRASGDPHFITLDGTSYTFNPVGEFIYLKTTDGADLIQARITQYIDLEGRLRQACYFSAFVVRSSNSDIVQVELNALNLFTFRINGQQLALENGYWSFNGITLNYQNNSTVVLHTASGIDLEIRILSGMLHLIYTLPESFKFKINGLVGDWDGISTNDFKLPNGTWLPVNSSNEDIHYRFGMAWSTTNETSIFSYPTGLAWSDYQNVNFVPDFSTPAAVAACAGDQSCDYDTRATGDLSVGLSNIMIRNRTDELNQINNDISLVCPAQVTVVYGNVKVEQDRSSAGSRVRYTVQCNTGYRLVGLGSALCVNGTFQPLGVCQAIPSYSSAHNAYVSFSVLSFAFAVICTVIIR